MDFIKQLLNTEPQYRLGSGKNGIQNIKKHPFFEGIDWHKMEEKLVPPPFIPPPKVSDKAPHYEKFEDIISSCGKECWLTDIPNWNQQRYFANWDFTSPMTLKLECGVFNAKKESEEIVAAAMQSPDVQDQRLAVRVFEYLGLGKPLQERESCIH